MLGDGSLCPRNHFIGAFLFRQLGTDNKASDSETERDENERDRSDLEECIIKEDTSREGTNHGETL
ncbi:hypothetical protein GCM10009039_29930 [Halocalculus aciditolerans]|uniref:Uncharacterized protein n=1 Tax=Halocalculus aciditolerans TaxID=1383812 RepID=A0A830FQA4_9EURY|nr:hypothetical protein GCM10009039_29930 [Halocalculus aciditolerans]